MTPKHHHGRDALPIRGIVTLRLLSPRDGSVVRELTIEHEDTGDNIVTNAGRAHIIDRLQGSSAPVANYIAIGTGTTAAAAGDTALGTEVARVIGTLSQPNAYTDRLTATIPAGTGTGSITECGRLNAAASGTLVGRRVFTAITKGASNALQVTYDLVYAAT